MRSAQAWLVLAVVALGSSLAACRGTRGARGECAAPACEPCCAAPVSECSPCGPRPAHAKAGEAWCCVWVPPVEMDEPFQVCLAPESRRCVWVPPAYGTRPKLVCLSPAALSERVKPGVFAHRQSDVLLKPARERVECICCPPGELAPGERQCGCVIKRETPSVWGKQCECVCLEPERRCVDFTPAQYECVEERYLVAPGFTQQVCEPARYETRTRRVCVSPGRWEWRRNERCELPKPVELTALQLEMVDSDPDGSKAGIFKVGSQVRYDVIVTGDEGSAALRGLIVSFTLPAELEFVSGAGDDGVTVVGAGLAAKSSAFDLGADRSLRLHLIANVKASPANQNLQVTAVVTDGKGEIMATETENSTVPN